MTGSRHLSVKLCDGCQTESALTIGTRSKDEEREDELRDANRKNKVHVDICEWRCRGAIEDRYTEGEACLRSERKVEKQTQEVVQRNI